MQRRKTKPKIVSFSRMQKHRRAVIEELIHFSGLSELLVERIFLAVECLVNKDNGVIHEVTFMSQMTQHFNLTNKHILSLIFNAMTFQRTAQNTISVEEYCKLLCIYLTKDEDTKVKFVFTVYDLDGSGELSKYEITSMLRPTLLQTEDDTEDMLKDMVDLVMKVFDLNRNGHVDLTEFRTLVKKNVLYMEILGQCMPEESLLTIFRNTLLEKSVQEIREIFQSDYTLMMLSKLISFRKASLYPVPLEY